jgi:hypothetical protein
VLVCFTSISRSVYFATCGLCINNIKAVLTSSWFGRNR